MARSRRTDEGNEGSGVGVTSLLGTLAKTGIDSIPVVTLSIIVLKVILYQELIKLPWDKEQACISADEIINNKDFKRMIVSVLRFISEKDLYFNMVSFMIKGKTIESKYGSSFFALLLVFFLLLINSTYVVLSVVVDKLSEDSSVMTSCTLGFAGICFALKVVTTAETGTGQAYIAGIRVPTKYAAWAEVIAIRQVVPDSPVMYQVAGILAGLAYVKTPLGFVVDKVIAILTGSDYEDLPHNSVKSEVQMSRTSKRSRKTKKSHRR